MKYLTGKNTRFSDLQPFCFQKIEINYFRFAGLVRYLHPSDEELRQYAPNPVVNTKKEKKRVNKVFIVLFSF